MRFHLSRKYSQRKYLWGCDIAAQLLNAASNKMLCLPTKYTKHQVEHKKGSQNDERYKIYPVEIAAQCIVSLQEKWENPIYRYKTLAIF